MSDDIVQVIFKGAQLEALRNVLIKFGHLDGDDFSDDGIIKSALGLIDELDSYSLVIRDPLLLCLFIYLANNKERLMEILDQRGFSADDGEDTQEKMARLGELI
ncbi:hypothetical protein L6279_04565, partial [Candidatus Parcubacteria bacterium]|nr:hypothetical protein [Candidatus Parcubacteria bacterium]